MEKNKKNKHTGKDYLRFIIPSIIGILLFMIPFTYQGEMTIFVAMISGFFSDALGGAIPVIVLIIIALSALLTLIYRISKPDFIEKNDFLKGLFDVNTFWLGTRIVGTILGFMTFFEIGPELVWSADTGGLILFDLISGLLGIFLFAGLLLPLLTEFGLLEFIGSLLVKIMRPLFRIPGRSAIDAIASWVGDGTIGVVITDRQYQEGYYSLREAATIATCFSAVSITFSLVVAEQVDMMNMFPQFYLSVTLAGLVCAIIVSRIPPISRKPDSYYKGTNKDETANIPEGYSIASWGAHLAVEKAKESGDIKNFITSGIQTFLNMWFTVMPIIMAFGGIALMLAEGTPIFKWLGTPFIPILNLLQVPYAAEASETMLVGFTDMFLPSVIGASIPSEFTRFVVGGISIVQLIYLSEVGGVILGSKIKLNLFELFIIFLERTIISLPILALAAHLIF